jgi:hypothetical protein
VLCKCDLVSIGRLLRVSSYIRSLYLSYPETAIQGTLSEIPQPVAGLLRVARALYSTSDGDLNADDALKLLRQANVGETLGNYSQFITSGHDALHFMRSLIDIYVEVDVAADIVAQGMNAAMQVYTDPHVVATPVVLSVTEHTRLVCALLIVRIYYQLRFKFAPNGHAPGSYFATAFMQTIAPWQMAQGMSVEAFLSSCQKSPYGLLYEIIDKRYTCCECLPQKSSYLRNYSKFAAVDMDTLVFGQHTSFLSFSHAAQDERRRISRRRSWAGHVGDAQHPDLGQAVQLCNYGWTMCTAIGSYDMLRQQLILRVGMLFWDQSRLADWNMVDQSDVMALGTQTAWRLGYMPQRHRYALRQDCKADTSHQIVEWTRSREQISFEEFLARQSRQ